MTALRWDNVPKPRVERPPLLAPGSNPTFRKTKSQSHDGRTETAGGTRNELPGHTRSASVGRCSVCKARGVTLWRVAGRLMCASCRAATKTSSAPHRKRRRADLPNADTKGGAAAIVTTGKNATWAARQGANDRKARTECPRYKDFLRTYNLLRSPFTLQLWNEYISGRPPARKNTAQVGTKRNPAIQADPPRKRLPATVAHKGTAWAARQGREDGTAGKACRKYKAFRNIYGLISSDASLRLISKGMRPCS